MSSQIPDPRTLETVDDAFKYPVVSVRGMEKKLRRDMDENHEKLRNLVGYASLHEPSTVFQAN